MNSALKSAPPRAHVDERGTSGALADFLARSAVDPAAGLSANDARALLERDGANELPPPPRPSAWRRFFSQFANPIVLTLLGAAVIAVIDGASRDGQPFLARYGDALAIFLIVALNAALGYYQEARAESALDALQKMQTPNARVRRDRLVETISATRLVAGDVVLLEAGDAVPADGRLVEAYDLEVEESSLTGESLPSSKTASAVVAEDAPLGDRSNVLFLGTNVVRGRAVAMVTATGVRTELGKLSELLHQPRDRKTPLEDKLEAFGKQILWVCLGLSALLFVRGLLKGGRWQTILLEAVSLAVAAIPEGLPAITTITLALGMQRMAKRGALVRKLAAVETLGAATVICSDKTGTLTQNEMTVREVVAFGRTFAVTGTGYDPNGEIRRDGAPLADPASVLRGVLVPAALCNNAHLDADGAGRLKAVGDPTEAALLTLAGKAGLGRPTLLESYEILHELAFDSDRKRMSVLARTKEGEFVLFAKGSADVLLAHCTHLAGPSENGAAEDIALDDDAARQILAHVERMSSASLRVLGFARRSFGLTDPGKDSGVLEEKLVFTGLVGMIDPPRLGVKEAVQACHEARVRAVMITGDHKLTAVAIARELGLWDEGATAITGSELTTMPDSELHARIESVRVFARVTAEQKLRIVKAFKTAGHVVAMTGDGVNDAPALREAHIGVAMGRGGTDVARQAADMVIADDNFATIVVAVQEGRAIYRNIQKSIFFLLSSNAGLVLTVFAASFMKDVLPLTPLMILWINLVTNGLPALALGIDPPDPAQMTEPPRKTTDAGGGLLRAREYLGIAAVGLWMGGAALACLVWPWSNPPDTAAEEARALAFSLLALSPLFHAFNCRSPSRSIAAQKPFFPAPLVVAVIVSAAIHLVAVLVPSLQPLFHTFYPEANEWKVMLLLAASIIPAIELLKVAQRAGIGAESLGPMSKRQ